MTTRTGLSLKERLDTLRRPGRAMTASPATPDGLQAARRERIIDKSQDARRSAKPSFIGFDEERGVIACAADMPLTDILARTAPEGWFLPSVPADRHITLGDAIAKDVHGMNQHVRGTLGRYVERLQLERSDGASLTCSPHENADLFRATVGGLGLTGTIISAELKLIPVESSGIDREIIRFYSLDDFADISAQSEYGFEYAAAWIDSTARDEHFGRGLFLRGNHSVRPARSPRKRARGKPVDLPFPLLNRVTLRPANAFIWRHQYSDRRRSHMHFEPFLYAFDRFEPNGPVYGRKGRVRHLSVLPLSVGPDAVAEMMARTQRAGLGSFMTMLKTLGDVPSPGLLSFPCSGYALTLDFPSRGEPTRVLLNELDHVVRQAKGRVRPGGETRMSAESFQAFFPNWRQLEPHIDPASRSGFWRHVTQDIWAPRANL